VEVHPYQARLNGPRKGIHTRKIGLHGYKVAGAACMAGRAGCNVPVYRNKAASKGYTIGRNRPEAGDAGGKVRGNGRKVGSKGQEKWKAYLEMQILVSCRGAR
jgi:hypothetical protein